MTNFKLIFIILSNILQPYGELNSSGILIGTVGIHMRKVYI